MADPNDDFRPQCYPLFLAWSFYRSSECYEAVADEYRIEISPVIGWDTGIPVVVGDGEYLSALTMSSGYVLVGYTTLPEGSPDWRAWKSAMQKELIEDLAGRIERDRAEADKARAK